MSSYDKLIKQATKPKAGAPKPKYIDPIIASSFSQDGSLQDICRALAGRLNDSSSLVVFRSLIVVHTLIRNGGVDNILSHLASSRGQLRFSNVAQGGNWQGYDAQRMLSPYATYLDERVKAYKELRHDVIRASDAARTRGGGGGTSDRSEGADSGLRLRRLTVEKGLLREVHTCQKVCSRLLDLFFAYFSDNVHDELALTAFRMSLKDLLAVYAAINEGVINVLEHYFEMSKVDATYALDIYKRFCSHTEKIVAYLASARKVSHSLNVPVPNLRHAPVSLAGALKEYLEDPQFEKNRKEYKENKRVADGGVSMKPAAETHAIPASTSKKSITIQEPTAEEKTKPVKPPTSNQALNDFFESIETDQMSMFGPTAQQQGVVMPQATGFGGPMMAPQMTGYNPFFGQQQTGFMGPQQTGFIPQQMTGFAPGGFLGPQMTGANPFRQSTMMQPTGAFGQGMMGGQQSGLAPPQQQQPQQPASANAFTTAYAQQPSDNNGAQSTGSNSLSPAQTPARAASTPLPKALQPQKTGSRNPFAPPPGSTPPPPKSPPGSKGPTLFELAFGGAGGTQGPSAGGGGSYGLGATAWQGNGQPQQQPQLPQQQQTGLVPQKTGLIGSIASEFVSGNPMANGASNGTQSPVSTPAAASSDLPSGFAGLSMNGAPQPQPQPRQAEQAPALQPQPTGFGGSLVQPFKPESSFGQSLSTGGATTPVPPNMTGNPFAKMPPSAAAVPQQSSMSSTPFGAPDGTAGASSAQTAPPFLTGQPTGFGSSLFGSSSGPVASQSTGFGSSLFAPSSSATPTTTTGGTPTGQAAPSFGASLFGGPSTPTTTNGSTAAANGIAPQPTGFAGSTVKPFQPSSAFGSAAFGSFGQPQLQQPQANNSTTGSLF